MKADSEKRPWFTRLSKAIARLMGRPAAFVLASAIVIIWAITGPLFHFSDTWQLVINTGTTIVTFLMVFLIQSTQNRDTEAIQIKLDEMIRALRGANNMLLDLEDLEDTEIERLHTKYEQLAQQARNGIAAGNANNTAATHRKSRKQRRT
jgi:low affinity Fe/Cu permease